MARTLNVPPDGGYGWVIVFSSALTNLIIVSLTQAFGLLFKDICLNLSLSATQGSLILNLNGAFGMITGPLGGVLLKVYGYRKIAVLSAFLVVSGMVLTAFSTTFLQFIIAYGLVTSLGMGINFSALIVALNSYFKENRNKAMSVAVTIPGFGAILAPQLIKWLLQEFTVEGVILICGGICGHLFVAAALLQPVEWHLKEELDSNEKAETVESSIKLVLEFDEKNVQLLGTPKMLSERPGGRIRNSWAKVSKFFGLNLLEDPVFVNIVLGLAFEFFAEINFTLLTPFILHDLGLTTEEIANFLSTVGLTDIIFRLLAPYIGNFFQTTSRVLYTYNLVLIVATRFSILVSRDFYVMLGVALGLGAAKGVRKVYMGLILPDYVPLEKLGLAVGIVMMVEGFGILIGGTAMGVVRDLTGTYTACVVIINCITIITAAIWTVEAMVVKFRDKSKL